MGTSPQFFGLALAENGLVYAAGQSGLLEFDGQEWRKITAGQGYMAGLVADEAGRLYVGGISKLLRLDPNASGGWSPKDLLAPLGLKPSGASPFFFAQQDPQDRSLWFSAINRLARVDAAGNAQVVREGGGVGRLIPWGDRLLLRFVLPGGAIFFASRGKLELVAPELAAELEGVTAAVPLGGQAILAFRAREFRHFEGLKPVGPWRPVPGLEGENSILCALHLESRRFVLGTQRGTALVLTADGQLFDRWTEADGLPGGSIRALRREKTGAVWMATDNGVARVESDSRFRRFALERGLKPPVLALQRHFGRLWAGTPAGVMRESDEGIFERQAGLPAAIWGFRADGEDLIVAGGGLMIVRPDGSTEKISTPASFAAIGDPEIDASGQLLVVPSSGALVLYRRNGQSWQFERTLPGFAGSAFDLAFAPDGTLWVADSRTRILRWQWRSGEGPVGPPEEVPHVTPMDDPPELRMAVWGETIWVASNAGLHRWDAAAARLQRADDLGSVAARRLTGIQAGPEGELWLLAGPGPRADQTSRVWRVSPAGKVAMTPRVEPFDVGPLAPKTLYGLRAEASGNVFLYGEGPLAVLASQRTDSPPSGPPICLIRRVSTERNAVFEGGAWDSAQALPFPLGQRSARFEFAAPWFVADSALRSHLVFRSRLRGLGETWSPWSAERRRDYTNLPPGRYVFEAQAGLGEESNAGPTAAFSLVVPAFWWETLAARLGLGLAVAVGIAAIAKVFSQRRLKQRVLFLEHKAEIENERLRIARDMHDDIGSSLAHISVTAQRLAAEIPEPRLRAQIQHIRTIAAEVMNSARDIIWSVNPQNDTLDSLASYLANWVHRSFGDVGIECRLDIPTDLPELDVPGPVRNAVFLATKEAVQNCIKHSGTKRAVYAVTVEHGDFICTLSDEGCWNRPENRSPGSGVGLGSLHARLDALGGSTLVESGNEGTRVKIRLPLQRRNR